MRELELLIGLILAATLLAAAARRVGAPYPVFLAVGGALLAFVPGAPSFTVLPELALAPDRTVGHADHGVRASEEIGDDAFHQMEEELDWIEMSGGGREEG